jgi:hypothetical protein
MADARPRTLLSGAEFLKERILGAGSRSSITSGRCELAYSLAG